MFCLWGSDSLVCTRIEMRERRKSCVARLQKEGRHAVSKVSRAITMKIAIEDSTRYNIQAERGAEDSQSEERN